MEVCLGLCHIVLDGDQLPLKGHSSPQFSAMSVVAKRSPISATTELLYIDKLTCNHAVLGLKGLTCDYELTLISNTI